MRSEIDSNDELAFSTRHKSDVIDIATVIPQIDNFRRLLFDNLCGKWIKSVYV